MAVKRSSLTRQSKGRSSGWFASTTRFQAKLTGKCSLTLKSNRNNAASLKSKFKTSQSQKSLHRTNFSKYLMLNLVPTSMKSNLNLSFYRALWKDLSTKIRFSQPSTKNYLLTLASSLKTQFKLTSKANRYKLKKLTSNNSDFQTNWSQITTENWRINGQPRTCVQSGVKTTRNNRRIWR